MRISPKLTVGLLGLLATLPALAVEATDVLERSFPLAAVAGHRAVEIDNVFGGVRVTAGAGDRVEIVVRRTWKADDAAALERARAEVVLDVVETPGRLELAQDGPFRDDCDERGTGRRRGQEPDYEVAWEWQVTVPRDVELEVASVNGGTVEVDGVRGAVEASNVNGEVRLAGLGGRASASTVNGDLRAAFAEPLAAPAEFSTVNGELELALPRGSGAELAFETLNGEVYTDFPVESRALPARVERDGHTWRIDGETVVRLGGGGPRLDCSTVNGDIVIRER